MGTPLSPFHGMASIEVEGPVNFAGHVGKGPKPPGPHLLDRGATAKVDTGEEKVAARGVEAAEGTRIMTVVGLHEWPQRRRELLGHARHEPAP